MLHMIRVAQDAALHTVHVQQYGSLPHHVARSGINIVSCMSMSSGMDPLTMANMWSKRM